jgi:HEAT repeat protein
VTDALRREAESLLERLTVTQGRDALRAMEQWVAFLARSPEATGDVLAELLAATPPGESRRLESLVAGLGWRRGAAARERLEALLVTPELPFGREDVVVALGRIADARSVPALLAAAALEDEFGSLGVKIAQALGGIEGSRPALEALARSELENVREAARRALETH